MRRPASTAKEREVKRESAVPVAADEDQLILGKVESGSKNPMRERSNVR